MIHVDTQSELREVFSTQIVRIELCNDMVHVGMIGPGPLWEALYRPAFEKLRERIAVTTVYHPVAHRAGQVAADCRAVAVEGLLSLLRHTDVDAVIVVETGWPGSGIYDLLSAVNKPVLIAGGLGSDAARLHRLHESAQAAGRTIMPALGRRYTPATGRLQELMATQIGPPREIFVDALLPVEGGAFTESSMGLFDWCRHVLRAKPFRVHSSPRYPAVGNGNGTPDDCTVRIDFHANKAGSDPLRAELRLRRDQPTTDTASPREGEVIHEIFCSAGHAVLGPQADIIWTRDGRSVTESLTTERSEVEVMLDLFCRRVVGGLIPVADIADVCRGLQIAGAAEESLRTGQPVDLNGLT